MRDGGRIVRKALVLAYGVHESGYREVIALDVGEAETEAFWRSFLRSLVERGLTGVQLVPLTIAERRERPVMQSALSEGRCTSAPSPGRRRVRGRRMRATNGTREVSKRPVPRFAPPV